MRETIEIVRKATRGERLVYEGRHYTLPLPGGEGKALRASAPSIAHLPVYIAALGPNSLRMTGELANGWVGTSFVPETADLLLGPLREGAEAAGRAASAIDIMAGGAVEFTAEVEEATARHARGLAFTLGAMGSPRRNFYTDAFVLQGWADDAKAVQRLWLEGKREEARARVPLEMARKVNLLGTDEMVRDRLRVYRAAGVTTLRVGLDGAIDRRVETLGRLMELVSELASERADGRGEDRPT